MSARVALALTLAALVVGAPAPARAQGLPRSALQVRAGDGWAAWWRSDAAPVRWTGMAPLARRLRLRDGASGVRWGELVLRGAGEAWRTRLVVVVLDPRALRLGLDTAYADGRPAWRAERLAHRCSTDAVFAVNAGQFVESLPWGWVVLRGERYLAPGAGPLVTAVMLDARGLATWRHAADPPAVAPPQVRDAFESFPTLLRTGVVPEPLRAAGRGVNVEHRDARLAIGRLSDDRLVVVLTRFDALAGGLARLPFGLTVPEMAAVMGALGARDAVMLDGGISAQLLLRDAGGTARVWGGLRAVPLALVARASADRASGRCR